MSTNDLASATTQTSDDDLYWSNLYQWSWLEKLGVDDQHMATNYPSNFGTDRDEGPSNSTARSSIDYLSYWGKLSLKLRLTLIRM